MVSILTGLSCVVLYYFVGHNLDTLVKWANVALSFADRSVGCARIDILVLRYCSVRGKARDYDSDTTSIVTATGMAPRDSAQRIGVCSRLNKYLTVVGGYFW